MRSLKMRPDLRKWLGGAFHGEMLAPLLNLYCAKTRSEAGMPSRGSSESLKLCSPLNQKEKVGRYELNTSDHNKWYLDAQESTVTTEVATTSDAGHERD